MQQQSQIFIYEDIRKQLAPEYNKYENIERIWKNNMDVSIIYNLTYTNNHNLFLII